MPFYKVILKSDTVFTDQEIEEAEKFNYAGTCFEVVSAINLEGTVEALTLDDFGVLDENNTTD